MTTSTGDYTTTAHEELPRIRQLNRSAPMRWLTKGVEDLKASKLHSLIYGLVFTLAGLFLIWQGPSNPLFTLFILSGFTLMGPLAAVGLYNISRRLEQGEAPFFARCDICT